MMDQRNEKGERKWAYEEEWDNDEGIGYLGFIAENRWRWGEATTYTNVEQHPRAVCIAALRAENADNVESGANALQR